MLGGISWVGKDPWVAWKKQKKCQEDGGCVGDNRKGAKSDKDGSRYTDRRMQ